MPGLRLLVLFPIITRLLACQTRTSQSDTEELHHEDENPDESFVCHPTVFIDKSSQFASASNKFFIDLYNKSNKINGDNFLVSPYSIFSGLSLLQLGTRGETEEKFQEVLHHQADSGLIHLQARNFLSSLEATSTSANASFVFTSANKAYFDRSIHVRQFYKDSVFCFYGSNTTSLDMRTQPSNSAEIINRWIENKTEGKITDLVGPSTLGPDSQAVLINTVYFKASWKLPFSESETKISQFRQESGTTIEVEMMTLEGHLPHFKRGALNVLELDYCTNEDCYQSEMAMYLFFPEDGFTFAQVEETILQEEVLSGSGLNFSLTPLRLEMPRLEVRQRMELGPILRMLELPMVGDFSGITNSPLQLRDVLHEVFLRVDEEGTEGSAATALFMSRMLFVAETTFRLDRTFFLSVVHKPSRIVVFSGKINKPGKIQD